jgi:hypothetical protein
VQARRRGMADRGGYRSCRANAVLSAGRSRRGTEQRRGGGHGGRPAGHRGTRSQATRPAASGRHQTQWTCRLTCPSTLDTGSPQVGGLRSRHGSFSQRYGPVPRQGREESRKRGGRAPKRADQEGQGTAGGCPPGSEARGTSRPGQAGMGPDHQPVNRQGPRGRRQPGMRTGLAARPGPGVRQPRPRLPPRAPVQGKSRRSRSTSPVTGASTCQPSTPPGRACLRTTTGRHRDGQRRKPGLCTDRGRNGRSHRQVAAAHNPSPFRKINSARNPAVLVGGPVLWVIVLTAANGHYA